MFFPTYPSCSSLHHFFGAHCSGSSPLSSWLNLILYLCWSVKSQVPSIESQRIPIFLRYSYQRFLLDKVPDGRSINPSKSIGLWSFSLWDPISMATNWHFPKHFPFDDHEIRGCSHSSGTVLGVPGIGARSGWADHPEMKISPPGINCGWDSIIYFVDFPSELNFPFSLDIFLPATFDYQRVINRNGVTCWWLYTYPDV